MIDEKEILNIFKKGTLYAKRSQCCPVIPMKKTLDHTVLSENLNNLLQDSIGALSTIYEKVAVTKGLTALIKERISKTQSPLMLASEMEQMKELNSLMWEAEMAITKLENNLMILKNFSKKEGKK